MWKVLLLALLLTSTSLHAQSIPSDITFGSTFVEKEIRITNASVVSLPGWLTARITPTAIFLIPHPSLVSDGETATVVISSGGVTYTIPVLAKCSTSSGCATVPLPTVVKTATPRTTNTPQPTLVIPTSVFTANGVHTAHPTVVRTSGVAATVTPPRATPVVNGFKTDPIRPTYRDVSISPQVNQAYPYKWCRYPNGVIIPSTQVCADALEQTRFLAAVNAITFARNIPACARYVRRALDISFLSEISAVLGPIYETNFGSGRGDWGTDADGKHYRKEKNVLEDFQKCALEEPQACAIHGNERIFDLLNLRREGNVCVKGALFTLPQPNEASYIKSYLKLGMIDYDVVMPPLTDHQKHLLHETHRLHLQVSDARCGVGSFPAAGAVTNAHIAFEAAARNESEHHFFTMKAFSGDVDMLWRRDQECKLARLQDFFHELWMNGVLQGDWLISRLAENGHQAVHLLMNLKDERFLVRLPCILPIRECPVQNYIDIIGN
jgi:hypothetical protein